MTAIGESLKEELVVSLLREDRKRLFRGRLHVLDQALGRSRFYFIRMLKKPEKLRLVDMLCAIDTLGFHPSEYLKRISGDHQLFGQIPERFLETRSLKGRKGSSRYQDLSDWAQQVAADPEASPLTLEIDPYLDLLGDKASEHQVTFGNALLEILRRSQPSKLTPKAISGCSKTLLVLAAHHQESNESSDALNLLSIVFCLAEKATDFGLRAQAYLATASVLKTLGFAKDASWCAYEGTLLSIGLGSFEAVAATLDLYQECCMAPRDHLDHLVQAASDERNASGNIVTKKMLDGAFGEKRQAFYQLHKGMARNTLTLRVWERFAQGLVTPLSMSRAFRMPFVPQSGAQLLEICMPSFEGYIPEEYHAYLTWLPTVEILDTPEPVVAFPSVAEAQTHLAECTFPYSISRMDAFRHATSCAVIAHHLRLVGDHQGAYTLFKAVLTFERHLDSLPLRSHLVRLSAYLLRDTGNLNEARIWAHRSLHCALAGRDAYSLAQSLFIVTAFEILSRNYQEPAWLLKGILSLAPASNSFRVSVYISHAFCLIKLGKLDQAAEQLRQAESVDQPHEMYPNICILRGIIASLRGYEQDADLWFEVAQEELDELGYPLGIILLGLYKVAHFIRFGQHEKAHVETKRLETLASVFPLNKLVRATILEVNRKTRQGHLTLQLIEYACRQIECPWQKIA